MDILIVDDDAVDTESIIRILKKSHIQADIHTATSVDEGLSLYRNRHYDLMLLDYRMPQRDGIEMVLEVRNEIYGTNTAIVMMSSSEEDQLALDCIRAGAQDFLIKSEITVSRLKRAILQAQSRFDLEQQLFDSYQKVKQLAETDSLTGLANRYLFDETLKLAVANNSRTQGKVALMLLDLDKFKFVNDTYGHDVGDALLQRLVARINGVLRGNEMFARLGGDEFAVLLTQITEFEHINLVALRILRALEKPLEFGDNSVKVTASIGIAIHPDNCTSAQELFKYADIAMYRAKKLGRNQMCHFEADMHDQFSQRYFMELELASALKQNEFHLVYQPKVDPQDGSIKGFEALIRWTHQSQPRFPDQFIPIAEESALINPIGLWVFQTALDQLQVWNRGRDIPFTMAINVSPVQLRDRCFLEDFSRTIKRHDVSPELIELELTETSFLADSQETKDTIWALSKMGFKLALDDFGTGYSSVSHLRDFPISTVKIDRSLMPSEPDDQRALRLLEGLVSMINILGLDVVAEGVETEVHQGLCKTLEIAYAQGYWYSKPLVAAELELFISEQS